MSNGISNATKAFAYGGMMLLFGAASLLGGHYISSLENKMSLAGYIFIGIGDNFLLVGAFFAGQGKKRPQFSFTCRKATFSIDKTISAFAAGIVLAQAGILGYFTSGWSLQTALPLFVLGQLALLKSLHYSTQNEHGESKRTFRITMLTIILLAAQGAFLAHTYSINQTFLIGSTLAYTALAISALVYCSLKDKEGKSKHIFYNYMLAIALLAAQGAFLAHTYCPQESFLMNSALACTALAVAGLIFYSLCDWWSKREKVQAVTHRGEQTQARGQQRSAQTAPRSSLSQAPRPLSPARVSSEHNEGPAAARMREWFNIVHSNRPDKTAALTALSTQAQTAERHAIITRAVITQNLSEQETADTAMANQTDALLKHKMQTLAIQLEQEIANIYRNIACNPSKTQQQKEALLTALLNHKDDMVGAAMTDRRAILTDSQRSDPDKISAIVTLLEQEVATALTAVQNAPEPLLEEKESYDDDQADDMYPHYLQNILDNLVLSPDILRDIQDYPHIYDDILFSDDLSFGEKENAMSHAYRKNIALREDMERVIENGRHHRPA